MPRFVVIGGGSFQGKSIIALHVANKMGIPAIVCTDTIRSVLRVVYPNRPYLSTSTYLLKPKDLEKQMEEVSSVMIGLLDVFERRGESAILEGMHFSEDSLDQLVGRRGFLLVCLNNKLPLSKRVELKSQTRSRIERKVDGSDRIEYVPLTKANLRKLPYLEHADRIEEIHKEILGAFAQRRAHVITFRGMNSALRQVDAVIRKWPEYDGSNHQPIG